MEKNEIQKEIINVLREKEECAFGDLVKQLDYPYKKVLHNILELKNKGEIQKLNEHQGNYVLS
jgi:hypothetical protein